MEPRPPGAVSFDTVEITGTHSTTNEGAACRPGLPFPCHNDNMRSLALIFALSLHAESPKLAPPDPAREQQTLDHIKQFALTHLDRSANLACTQVGAPASSKTITIELAPARHGTPSSIDAGAYLEDVFAASSATEFQWDHWSNAKGKTEAVYRYSSRANGKTLAGLIFADENGAISRITFRGADAPAHLFCSAKSR
jgi:hypothetical protein